MGHWCACDVEAAEPELGIGILIHLNDNVGTFQFPQAKISRRYSLKNAPLRRALLSKGQNAKLKDSSVLKSLKTPKSKRSAAISFGNIMVLGT